MRIEENDLCVRGLTLLIESLGKVEAERFIMLMNQGAGDYTEWRRTHLYEDMELRELAARAKDAGKQLRSHRLANLH